MTLYEDPIENSTITATNSLPYSDNLHSYDFYRSPPLILRSYTSMQSSNASSNKPQQKYHEKDNQNHLTDALNKNTNHMKLSIDYIYRLIEQNERRYEEQEHIKTIAQEWQILGRVVDRVLVFLFLISALLVFLFIFLQAPHIRLK